MIRKFGYQISGVANSCDTALEILASTAVDVVLMDIRIHGDKDGIETAYLLREQQKNIPIVYLTGVKDEKFLRRAKESKPQGFICKPASSYEIEIALEMAAYKAQSMAALEKSEKRFANIMRNARSGLILQDKTDGIFLMNPQAEQLLGVSENETFGKIFENLIQLRNENDTADIDCNNTYPANVETETISTLRSQKGEKYRIKLFRRTLPEQDGQLTETIILQDVTQNYQANRRISLLITALQELDEAVILAEETDAPFPLNILYTNPAFSKISGVSQQELADSHFSLPKENANTTFLKTAIFKSIQTGESFNIELEQHRKDDEKFLALWSAAPIQQEGDTNRYWIYTLRDITHLRQLEDNILQSRKLEAIGRLADGLAHDFNNIIAIVNGLSELMLRQNEPGTVNHVRASQILEASQRGGRIISQLLTFSRKEGESHEIIEPAPIISELIPFFQHLFSDNITVNQELLIPKTYLEMNQSQLEQIFLNLCTNARDAIGEENHGTITIQLGINTLNTKAANQLTPKVPVGDYFKLKFTDTGCGMDEKTRTKIFDPFFTTKDVGKGTGLGMSTIYGIIKNHKGGIRIDSTLGKGTSFEIHLPVLKSRIPKKKVKLIPASSSKAPFEKSPKKIENKRKIWVHEPNELLGRSVKTTLEAKGFLVTISTEIMDSELRQTWINTYDAAILPQDLALDCHRQAISDVVENKPHFKFILTHKLLDEPRTHETISESITYLQSPYSLRGILRDLSNIKPEVPLPTK